MPHAADIAQGGHEREEHPVKGKQILMTAVIAAVVVVAFNQVKGSAPLAGRFSN